MQTDQSETSRIYRVLDANINRLREGLRVTEEYFRFIRPDPALAAQLKSLRHGVEAFENGLDRRNLLAGRDTGTDPFASVNRPEELGRSSPAAVAAASLKRCQEAARVLEEYVKLTPAVALSETAKTVRFSLYSFEKHLQEHTANGEKKSRQG